VGELGGPLADSARFVHDAAASRGSDKTKTVAVFSFVSEDWSPWIALARMRERGRGSVS
jgi:hypothetical protein